MEHIAIARKKVRRAGAPRTVEPLPAEAGLTAPLAGLQRQIGNRALQRLVLAGLGAGPVPDQAQRAPAAAEAEAGTPDSPTPDRLLNEWLAQHPEAHLSHDPWITTEYPRGGGIDDLTAGFRAKVKKLLDFRDATAGLQFRITSYARSSEKQHVMHVAWYIARRALAYRRFRFSDWPGVNRRSLNALSAEERSAELQRIANPDNLNIVWDTGTLSSSRADAEALVGFYHVVRAPGGAGSAYSWPTGVEGTSRHVGGAAVDADPVTLPNTVTITRDEAHTWPSEEALTAAFGADNVTWGNAEHTQVTIRGLSVTTRRNQFIRLFFDIWQAAICDPPFDDVVHWQDSP